MFCTTPPPNCYRAPPQKKSTQPPCPRNCTMNKTISCFDNKNWLRFKPRHRKAQKLILSGTFCDLGREQEISAVSRRVSIIYMHSGFCSLTIPSPLGLILSFSIQIVAFLTPSPSEFPKILFMLEEPCLLQHMMIHTVHTRGH